MLCLYRAENSQILTMPNQGRNVIRLDPFFILRTNRPPLNYLSSMTAWSTIRKSEINLLQLDMNVGFREVHRSIRFQLQSPLWAVSANLAPYPLSSRPRPKHRLIIAHPPNPSSSFETHQRTLRLKYPLACRLSRVSNHCVCKLFDDFIAT